MFNYPGHVHVSFCVVWETEENLIGYECNFVFFSYVLCLFVDVDVFPQGVDIFVSSCKIKVYIVPNISNELCGIFLHYKE